MGGGPVQCSLRMPGRLDLIGMLRTLNAVDNVSCLLSDELRIMRTNPAWDEFARANGGEQLLAQNMRGVALMEVIPEPLRRFYRDGFSRTQQTGERWEHDYECSSADVFRKYRMIAYPFEGGIAVTHALLVAEPHRRDGFVRSDRYLAAGVITMCCHCRRVRRPDEPTRWDWVPAYVTGPPATTSHGLCPPCSDFYYGDA